MATSNNGNKQCQRQQLYGNSKIKENIMATVKGNKIATIKGNTIATNKGNTMAKIESQGKKQSQVMTLA